MHNTMKQSQEINMGREDSKRLCNATCCHICKNNYSKKEIKARRDNLGEHRTRHAILMIPVKDLLPQFSITFTGVILIYALRNL